VDSLVGVEVSGGRRLLAIFAAPFFAARVLLGKSVQVRFRVLPVDEIGPLTLEPHHYLWSLRSQSTSQCDRWVVKPGTFACNQLVLNKWKSFLRIEQSWIAWYTFRLVSLIGGEKYYLDVDRYQFAFNPRLERCYLNLTPREWADFEQLCSGLRVDLERPVVAFAIRDSQYKFDAGLRAGLLDHKESYRNHDIASYELAATKTVEAGFQVVRVGARVAREFPPGNPGVTDYATSGKRSEIGDLGFASVADLCVTSSLGLDTLYSTFGKRKCAIGLFHYQSAQLFYPWDLLTFRRLRESNSGRELNLSESLSVPQIRNFRGDQDFVDSGLELIPNTPTEIAQYVAEALDAEPSYHTLSDAEKEVQARFWKILERELPAVRHLPIERRARISLRFAEEYDWWIV